MRNSFLISQRDLANIPLYNVIPGIIQSEKASPGEERKSLKYMDGRKHHLQLPSSLKPIRRSPRIPTLFISMEMHSSGAFNFPTYRGALEFSIFYGFLISQWELANIPLYNVIWGILQSAKASPGEARKTPERYGWEKTSSPTSLIPEAHQKKPKNSHSFHLHGNAFLWRV
ncbi:hypothetical protein CDAR_586901 [Caerostris darwini]|uniref:Uncharacterized protein n=1 Tax=Caerostris darwini TaxID=1538125 RepID=A0AAV4VIK6_9ARAC|nr:hypothetical protein CDAR_586901 [Caerostris darwini]